MSVEIDKLAVWRAVGRRELVTVRQIDGDDILIELEDNSCHWVNKDNIGPPYTPGPRQAYCPEALTKEEIQAVAEAVRPRSPCPAVEFHASRLVGPVGGRSEPCQSCEVPRAPTWDELDRKLAWPPRSPTIAELVGAQAVEAVLKAEGLDDYQRQAMKVSRDGGQPPEAEHMKWIMIAALGLCGEAGEVADNYKKLFEQDRPFDRADLVKELGDVLWYVARIAAIEGIRLSEVAEANIAKLQARYPNGFVPGGGVR